jgi:glyoxylase-like metal-dependent hydrolase (beta-lactamase superfamily II)
MQDEIRTICLSMPFRMGMVNCYLINTEDGFILIDTGVSTRRKELLQELERAGCEPGLLKLIVITHGDFDHTGNAADLRRVLGGKIAMHAEDVGMVEYADMFFNRKKPSILFKILLPLFSRFGKEDRFTPDLLLQDGDNLSAYGLEARILSIPGHSKGSIAILAGSGELFCGDLLVNIQKPELNALTDNLQEAADSLERLQTMGVGLVFPGHGKSFEFSAMKV